MTDIFTERMKRAEENIRKRRGIPAAKLKKEKTNGAASVGVSTSEVKTMLKEMVDISERAIRDDMNDVIEAALNSVREQRLVVTLPNEVEKTIEGIVHNQFSQLVKAASVRGYGGHRKNIMLTGPMGSGKSTACKGIADLFDLTFGYIGQTNMPHQVVGNLDPIDKTFYRHTAFTTAFIYGGVCVLEELDAWHPNASLVVNAPLANGYLELENGEFYTRHPDCIIIACANTWGTGATAEYVGRNKLDNAFLDRFGIKFAWGYDEDLERAAAQDDKVVDAVQKARFNAGYYGIKVPISPRSSIDIADMVRSGFEIREAMKMNFLASVDDTTMLKLMEDVDV